MRDTPDYPPPFFSKTGIALLVIIVLAVLISAGSGLVNLSGNDARRWLVLHQGERYLISGAQFTHGVVYGTLLVDIAGVATAGKEIRLHGDWTAFEQ